jgi:hypothetical protein
LRKKRPDYAETPIALALGLAFAFLNQFSPFIRIG